MRLSPRSLVARIGLLVAVVGVLSLALHLAVIWLWVKPLGDELPMAMQNQVRLTRALLARTSASERAAVAAAFGTDHFVIERREGMVAAPPRPVRPMPAPLLERLRRGVGPEFTVQFVPPGPGGDGGEIQFDFQLQGEQWRIAERGHPPLLAMLGTGLGWLILVGVGVFVSLGLGVRSIARPMGQLARQLSVQGPRLRSVPLPSNAGTELTAVVAAFNQLVAEVERAEQVKQHMLAGVAHDLRTPLSRLRLRVETECDDVLADRLTGDLRAIERIVSQFLAYGQGDVHSASGEPESVSAMVAQVVAGYAAQGLPVEMRASDLQAELPDIGTQRALGNLIDNALAHGAAPVEVALETRVTSAGAQAVLTVWDHGPGMSEADFVQAQLPFVRLETARAGLGHCGLGLAIVAQIAGQLGAVLRCRRDETGRFGISIAWPLRPQGHDGKGA